MSKLLAELPPFAIGLAIAAGGNRQLHTVSRIAEAVRNALAFSAAFVIIAAVVLITASTTSGGLVDEHTKSLDEISGL
jgi:hypothetical protein